MRGCSLTDIQEVENAVKQICSACMRRTELYELPGRVDKYCLECSADVATSILVCTEMEAAKRQGEDATELEREFAEVVERLRRR